MLQNARAQKNMKIWILDCRIEGWRVSSDCRTDTLTNWKGIRLYLNWDCYHCAEEVRLCLLDVVDRLYDIDFLQRRRQIADVGDGDVEPAALRSVSGLKTTSTNRLIPSDDIHRVTVIISFDRH